MHRIPDALLIGICPDSRDSWCARVPSAAMPASPHGPKLTLIIFMPADEEEGQEEDSNDEGWEGNDYPDEGHWGQDPDVIDDVYPDEVRAWQSYAVNDEEDGDYDYQFD